MKALLCFVLLTLGARAFAQDKVGNGGGLWGCPAANQTLSKGMLVDLFEARQEFGLQLIDSAASDPMQVVQERADFLKKYWPERYQDWSPILALVSARLHFVEEPLQEVHDSFFRIRPAVLSEGCPGEWQYVQFANFTNLGALLIDKKLWVHPGISSQDKAALIWHEVIYRWLRETRNEKDSIATRVVVGLLFSTLPLELMKQRIDEALKPPPSDPNKIFRLQLNLPLDGAVLSGDQVVLFSVQAPLMVQPQVFLYIDEGVMLAMLSIAPYQYKLNTRSLPNGRHKIYGALYSSVGAVDSNVVTIHIQN